MPARSYAPPMTARKPAGVGWESAQTLAEQLLQAFRDAQCLAAGGPRVGTDEFAAETCCLLSKRCDFDGDTRFEEAGDERAVLAENDVRVDVAECWKEA